jgi:hypothetical protein
MVSISTESTRDAAKLRLIAAIGSLSVPALGTTLACVSRIDRDQQHACQTSLIGQKLAQLSERPIASFGAVVFALNPRPHTNARQFLNGNGALCAFGTPDNTLADNVIGVSLKTRLAPTKLFKVALGRTSALALQLRAKSLLTLAIALNCFVAIRVAVRCDRNIYHSKIDANNTFNVNWRRLFDLAGGKQVKHAADITQVAFTSLAFKQFNLTLACGIGNFHPTCHSPNADAAHLGTPSQDAIVVRNCAARLERTLRFLVQFVRIANLGNQPNNHLRGQIKSTPRFSVYNLMKCESAKNFRFPRALAHPITSSIRHLKRLQEKLTLFGCGKKFDFSGQFHTTSLVYIVQNFNPLKGGIGLYSTVIEMAWDPAQEIR